MKILEELDKFLKAWEQFGVAHPGIHEWGSVIGIFVGFLLFCKIVSWLS